MPLLEIKNCVGAVLYSAEASSIAELIANAVKDGVALNGANLYGASLNGASLNGANLNGANLYGANLNRANLYGANLDRASLDRASLNGANLDRASLDRASLNGASLDRANLTGASLTGANLTGANLTGANLTGANLNGANLDRASLNGASLNGANLDGATIIETGETWAKYLAEVLPALLTAGGKALADVLAPQHWDCHSWENCPMAAAFETRGIEGVPLLLKPRAEQFIRYFDAKLIPLEAVGQEIK